MSSIARTGPVSLYLDLLKKSVLGDLYSENVGWLKDTLPAPPIEKLALLRLDVDLFESTRDVCEALYDRVSPGGFLVVDDCGCLPQCQQTVTAFRERRAITEPTQEVDWTSVFWRKER
jgi:O-methyltransferase